MKNMIKRIIIGICIGLVLMFFKSCQVNAKELDTYLIPNSTYQLTPNTDLLTIPVNNIFTNYGSGNVLFNFYSVIGGNYANAVRDIRLKFNTGFTISCEYNAVNYEGSGPTGIYYSVKCPVNMTNLSLSSIVLRFNYPQSSTVQPHLVYVGGIITFVTDNNSDIINSIIQNSSKNNTSIIIGQIDSVANSFGAILNQINEKLANQNFVQQQQLQQQQQTNQKLDETNDFLKDTSLPSGTSGDVSDLNDNIATNGTISSLVTMPITFLQKIINSLNGSCSPITIGELYNYNMTMPCINPQDYIGIIWNIIDVICAGFLSYHFGKKLVNIFHKVTSMKDGGLEEAYD